MYNTNIILRDKSTIKFEWKQHFNQIKFSKVVAAKYKIAAVYHHDYNII